MTIARQIDAEVQTILDIDKPKDSRGKVLTGAGHLKRAYVVAVRFMYEVYDTQTGVKHYNSELYFCEVKDVKLLEKYERESREIDAHLKEKRRAERETIIKRRNKYRKKLQQRRKHAMKRKREN